jgi:hypothetical protein
VFVQFSIGAPLGPGGAYFILQSQKWSQKAQLGFVATGETMADHGLRRFFARVDEGNREVTSIMYFSRTDRR